MPGTQQGAFDGYTVQVWWCNTLRFCLRRYLTCLFKEGGISFLFLVLPPPYLFLAKVNKGGELTCLSITWSYCNSLHGKNVTATQLECTSEPQLCYGTEFDKRGSLLLFSNYAKTFFFEVIKQPKPSNDLKNSSPFAEPLFLVFALLPEILRLLSYHSSLKWRGVALMLRFYSTSHSCHCTGFAKPDVHSSGSLLLWLDCLLPDWVRKGCTPVVANTAGRSELLLKNT